jgi:hypothetical protein
VLYTLSLHDALPIYNGIAPILIVLPKHPNYPGEKYQLHFGVSIDDHPMKSDYDIDDYIDKNDMSSLRLDEVLEYGQIMDERDNPVTLGDIMNIMGGSWDEMIDAYLVKFPDRRWQLQTNLNAAEGGDNES